MLTERKEVGVGGARLPKNLIPQKGGLPARYCFKPRRLMGRSPGFCGFCLFGSAGPSLPLSLPLYPPVSLCFPLPI